MVLSNSISMKAEVDFMHAIKHLEMTLANSVAGVTVFTDGSMSMKSMCATCCYSFDHVAPMKSPK